MREKVRAFMEKYHMVTAGERVLLGLSGGAMSQPAADLLTFLVSIPFQIWFFRHKLR